MKVAVASDHAGFELKEFVKKFLEKKGIEVLDFGTHSTDSVDYPDYIKLASRSVAKGEADFGVVVCGSGVGASIVANKVRGIRCALALNEYLAEMSRRHNNANVLALGGRVVTPDLAERILNAFFSGKFEGGRHERRVRKIAEIEKEECGENQR